MRFLAIRCNRPPPCRQRSPPATTPRASRSHHATSRDAIMPLEDKHLRQDVGCGSAGAWDPNPGCGIPCISLWLGGRGRRFDSDGLEFTLHSFCAWCSVPFCSNGLSVALAPAVPVQPLPGAGLGLGGSRLLSQVRSDLSPAVHMRKPRGRRAVPTLRIKL